MSHTSHASIQPACVCVGARISRHSFFISGRSRSSSAYLMLVKNYWPCSCWYASPGLWNCLPASPCHPHPSLFKGRYALPVTCKPMYGLYLRSIYASAFLDTCIYSLYVQVLKGSRVYTIHMYVCVFDTDTYGQYIRVNFSTLVHVGCIYGPCIRAIFTGSDYRP